MERKVGGHKGTEGGEGVMERLGEEGVRCDDGRAAAVFGMHGLGVFLGIKLLLGLDRFSEFFVGLVERDGFDPGHEWFASPWV